MPTACSKVVYTQKEGIGEFFLPQLLSLLQLVLAHFEIRFRVLIKFCTHPLLPSSLQLKLGKVYMARKIKRKRKFEKKERNLENHFTKGGEKFIKSVSVVGIIGPSSGNVKNLLFG